MGATGNSATATFEQTERSFNDSATVSVNWPSPVPETAILFLVGAGLIAIAGIIGKKLLNKKTKSDVAHSTQLICKD